MQSCPVPVPAWPRQYLPECPLAICLIPSASAVTKFYADETRKMSESDQSCIAADILISSYVHVDDSAEDGNGY